MSALLRRDEAPQRATFLELFFDLVFILTLLRLGQALVDHLTWIGALETLILLLASFSIWAFTASVCDTFDPSRPVIELLIFGAMVGALVMAVAIPGAPGAMGLCDSAGVRDSRASLSGAPAWRLSGDGPSAGK